MFLNRIRITIKFATNVCKYSQKVPQPLRSKKPKSTKTPVQNFIDLKTLRATGGCGGNGCISFLSLWSNEFAGPDGGDGGNGGHVIFKANSATKDLINVPPIIRAEDGEKGQNKDCNGKNAPHCIVDVPVGTVVKNANGVVVGDLSSEGIMFVAARGGAGGKGNHFFVTDTEQAPKICEYGAEGEDLEYTLEIKSMAHVGLIGFPNAGKSTLLSAVSRARPKIAPYPFTTLKPHIGMVQYDDYEQIAVADLPGLIPESHKNRGLGIQFLKHAERCTALLYIIDLSLDKPWQYLHTLQYELSQFSKHLLERPQLVIANKIDLPEAEKNLELLKQETDLKVIPVSAKLGTNITQLLQEIRVIYDQNKTDDL
ncbi:mitochondrial ribosome-associated GTPase 2 [Tribolium castaneum]|uniref:mitochondrial ribosome-associated GTPase 2 n=1 Tax=Tribolium castaneum TaxID=7070 RepID=UPI0000D563C2|nr:PREDICTED: mitochondrial ribosome-associated GTPase 2 [Tribolium castaneum]|eukprot:XP_966382.1 PREDICTED: mitochondrial ribosome-associated GTPase 2 [Tribolium castaneum]